eukprot:scaffold535_cov260-Pinguiococcus_pyrenoidosus.AAC.14
MSAKSLHLAASSAVRSGSPQLHCATYASGCVLRRGWRSGFGFSAGSANSSAWMSGERSGDRSGGQGAMLRRRSADGPVPLATLRASLRAQKIRAAVSLRAWESRETRVEVKAARGSCASPRPAYFPFKGRCWP